MTHEKRQRGMTLIEDPFLEEASANGTTAVKTQWHLAADPMSIDTVWVGFLGGNDAPTFETDTPFDVDGVRYKVRIDFGVAAMDWRGLYADKGAS